MINYRLNIYFAEAIFIYIIPKLFMLIVKWNILFRRNEGINTPTNKNNILQILWIMLLTFSSSRVKLTY